MATPPAPDATAVLRLTFSLRVGPQADREALLADLAAGAYDQRLRDQLRAALLTDDLGAGLMLVPDHEVESMFGRGA